MSLHTRFLLLLAMLGAAVLINIGVAVWSVGFVDRQQRWPAEQIASVLGVLNDVKRRLWEQAGEVGFFAAPENRLPAAAVPDTPSADQIERFRMLGGRARSRLDDLDEVESHAIRSGVNTIDNLRARMDHVNSNAEAFFEGDEDAGRAAIAELYTLHELIERIEQRLIEDAQFSAAYGDRVRERLTRTLIGSVLSVAVALAVGGWLFRRWVILRIDLLRLAAERIGRGDFEHRVAVDGDDELDRVGMQLNEMTRTIVAMQAERIERERLAAVGEMARRLAHNIRNPLGGIRSLAELSKSESDGDVRDQQERIIRTVDQFTRWLNDLLSVSNPLSVEPAPVDVPPWLEACVETHRPIAEGRGLRLTLDSDRAPRQATFDHRHLEHALSAIITNAVDASEPGGEIRVSAETLPVDRRWRIRVADEGPGITGGALDSLFMPYFTTKPGGTGIGLAQARRVVLEHGGAITARNAAQDDPEATGAVFELTLPLAPGADLARIGQNDEANCGQDTVTRRRRDAAVHRDPRAGA